MTHSLIPVVVVLFAGTITLGLGINAFNRITDATDQSDGGPE